MPGVVRHLHLDEDVAGEELALHFALFAALHLDERFGRDLDLAELLAHTESVDALVERLFDPLLESGVGVDDVPLLLAGFHHDLDARPELREEKVDSLVENEVAAPEEHGEDDRGDDDYDGRVDDFLPPRPGDLL